MSSRRPARAATRPAGRPSAASATRAEATTVGSSGPGTRARPVSSSTHGQLEEPEALTAPPLGQVDSQPSLGGHLLPDRLELLVLGVEQGPGHRSAGSGRRASDGTVALERLVLFGDGDRHMAPLFARSSTAGSVHRGPASTGWPWRTTLGRHPDPVLGVDRAVDDHDNPSSSRSKVAGAQNSSCPSPRTCHGRSRSGSSPPCPASGPGAGAACAPSRSGRGAAPRPPPRRWGTL